MTDITYDNIPPLEIRRHLDELCNTEKYSFDDPIKYKQVFFPEFYGKLTIIEAPPDNIHQRNCFAFALGYHSWVYPYTIKKLIDLEAIKPISSPKKNDIAIYTDREIIKHTALFYSENEVISKWSRGPVIKHLNFMCPASYGNTIRYYSVVKTNVRETIEKYLIAPNA